MASPVATVWAKFRLDMSDFASKLNSASASMRSFAKTQQSAMKAQNQGYASANAMIKTFNRSLNDTINITRGIVISQAFYAAVGAINDATSALWEFNKQLDYAHVTYSALFGDATLASNFMSVLQEHAIETIFDYQDLAGISKKLLAYGIEYENLMFIMEGLTNLGTMSGDSAALDRIALALGQIYTKGKLSAEEMRQLANAYVPITEIIQEKFNLSEADLERVGDLNLPAEQVINAIVDYANENFGSVGDAAMYTITGLEAKIVDTLKTVGAEMLGPLTTAYKSFLVYVAEGLTNIREAFASGGVGGIFEYLVPDEDTQKTIRIFVANIKNLFTALMSLGKAAGQVFGNFAQVFVAVFNAVVPAITAITNALAILINAMASTSAGAATLRIALVAVAGAFVLMRIQAMGALVITVVTKAVNTLSKALVVLATVIAKHPILSLLAMLGMALLGISVSSDAANNSLSGFFDTIAGAGGSSSGDVLQNTNQSIKDAEGALDDFNNRLEEGKDDAEDMEDAVGGIGDAAKRTKSLLSFDEVFKLNEPADSSSSGGNYDGILGDIEGIVGGLGALGDALIPEIPDFSEYLDSFNNGLLGGLSDDLREKIAAGGWGALIGGILGGLIGLAFGNPMLGAKIGMAVGAIAGVIFDELEYAISNTGVGAIAGIAAAIAKAFESSFGQVVKTLVSTGTIDDFFRSIAQIFSATGVKSLLKGGVIGAAIGLLVDGIAHLLWGTMADKFSSANEDTAKVGQTIGSLIGTVIGGLIGGPAGMLIGSAIGTFVGGLVGLFWEPIKNFFVDLGVAIGDWFMESIAPFFVMAWEDLSTWWIDTEAGFKSWRENTQAALIGWFADSVSGFAQWVADTFGSIGQWWADTVATFSDWDSITSDTLYYWWSDTKDGFEAWKEDTLYSLSLWFEDTLQGFVDWFDATWADLSFWWTNTVDGFLDWRHSVYAPINDFVESTVDSIVQWVEDTIASIAMWFVTTTATITQWTIDVVNKFTAWKESVLRVVIGFFIAVGKEIGGGLSDVWFSISGWFSDVWTSISTWFNNTKANVKTKWESLWDPARWKSGWNSIKQWFTNLFSDIGSWFTSIGSSIKTWWDGLWDNLSTPDVSLGGIVGGAIGGALGGHSAGGIFNREHIARFAEGNKAEAIIPLENARAMQPFVDAVSGGIVSSLAPLVASINGNSNNLPPLYVGTLVADERGLKQLYNKFELIRVQEDARKGLQST